MPADRFFFEGPFTDTFVLTGDECKHLSRVMRKGEGDRVEVINGQGELAHVEVTALTKHEAHLHVIEIVRGEEDPPLTLIQALPTKLSSLELILQKGTELGVTTFIVTLTSRGGWKQFSPNQLGRASHILITALKQCGRLTLPTLTFFSSLKEVPKQESPLFGDLRARAPSIREVELTSSPAIFIGPESGFTSEEIALLETDHGAMGVRLSKHILRTETAAIAAAALMARENGALRSHRGRSGE